jgi:acyl transferase domain-containing protein
MVKDKSREQQNFTPIAIVGIGALFAGSKNAGEFWRNIIDKRDLITDIPKSHWLISDYYEPCQKTAHQNDKIYAKRGSFIEDIEFDPVEFGIPPSTLSAIDTSQLLALIVAKQVLNDISGNDISKLNLERTSVILGVSVLEAVQYLSARTQRPVWEKALRETGLSEELIEKACNRIANHYPKWQEDSFPGLLSNVVSGRIANRFNFGGTNCTTDAACASSLAAILSAVNELQAGTADMVVTGGVDSLNDILMFKCFSIVGALSSSQHCKPFSEAADGTLLGEGVALFALKRLQDAEKNNDKIYGVIKGMGTSSDGRSKSIYAPVSEGQSKAVLRTYQRAGYDINTVGLIEAHGTGTIAGDIAEYNGLVMAFKHNNNSPTAATCALGSVKSQLGHTKSAAGAAGLLKALLSIRHKTLPATLHVDKVNSRFDQHQSPLYINTQTRPWIQKKSQPRRAGVSCFGFGGSNFHLTLEEYQQPALLAPKIRTLETELIILSGESQQALESEIKNLLQSNLEQQNLSYIAYQTQQKFQQHFSHSYRMAIVAHSTKELENKLKQKNHPDVYFSGPQKNEQTAFVFSGEGGQYLNMSKDLLLNFDAAMTVWENFATEEIINLVYPLPVFSVEDNLHNEQKLNHSKLLDYALALVAQTQLTLLDLIDIKSSHSIGLGCGEIFAEHYVKENSLIALLKKPKHPTLTHSKVFQQSVKDLFSQGVRTFIEIGPQQKCTELIKDSLSTDERQQISIIALDKKNEHSVTVFWHAMAKLICAGHHPNLLALWKDYIVDAKEQEKPARFTLKINGTNYQKPYPNSNSDNQPIQSDLIQSVESKKMSSSNSTSLSTTTTLLHELQRQLIEVHNNHQNALLQSHMAFLNTFSQLINPQQTTVNLNAPVPVVSKSLQMPSSFSPPVSAPVFATTPPPSAPIMNITSSLPEFTLQKPPQSPSPILQPAYQQVAVQQPAKSEQHSSSTVKDPQQIVMDIIVEKTGYPLEMLNPQMDIEADLGIDSIKRVEILSTLRERMPGLPEIPADELSALKTLQDIIDFIDKNQSPDKLTQKKKLLSAVS